MAGKEVLTRAHNEKNDEFYTQLSDIEQELKHYKKSFKDKIILCNCDDPFESNFFKYFALNFNTLGLKKLICTCYDTSPILGTQLSLFEVDGLQLKKSQSKKAYKIVINHVEDLNNDGAVDMLDIQQLIKTKGNVLTLLKGNGDFRSEECKKILALADIVVTNPPFSLFREYIALLMEYKKKFIIMGNKNAITYKEFFPYLKNNQVWPGTTSLNGGRWMIMPNNIEIRSKKTKINEYGQSLINIAGVCWFTNLDIKKRHESLVLYKKYDESTYPKYDNYDAINVDKVTDIPCNYDGAMGVPITFLDKYNPDQFEIIKFRKGNDEKDLSVNGKCPYCRILIKRKK